MIEVYVYENGLNLYSNFNGLIDGYTQCNTTTVHVVLIITPDGENVLHPFGFLRKGYI